VQLEEPGEDAVTDLMIKSLSRCIGDQDRFQVPYRIGDISSSVSDQD
jgi:hypothetical protein